MQQTRLDHVHGAHQRKKNSNTATILLIGFIVELKRKLVKMKNH